MIASATGVGNAEAGSRQARCTAVTVFPHSQLRLASCGERVTLIDQNEESLSCT